MSFYIGPVLIENEVIIAPMAGITNPAFRSMLLRFKPGLLYTEMVSDKAIVFRNKRTLEMCDIQADEHPISLQLFGHDIDSMVKAAQTMDQETKCDIIDINMGCPVNKVTKTGAGSALLRDPEYAYTLVQAIVQAVEKPVTVKIRMGYDNQHITAVDMAKAVERAGAKALAIHGRTRPQMYSGEVNLEIIKQVREAIQIPLIANGNVNSVERFLAMKQETKADAVMIGRAILSNPWLIESCRKAMNPSQTDLFVRTDVEKFVWLDEYAQQLIQREGEVNAMKHLRGQCIWLVSGMPQCAGLKRDFSQMKSYDEFGRIIGDYIKERGFS